MSQSSSSSSGIGFGGLLTVLFIGLKLCHVVDWSWWWVLCPIWIPMAIAGFFLMGALICFGLAKLVARHG